MSAAVIGLALSAAILHATWNAFLRSGGDRLWTVTVMSFASTIVALPFVLIYPLPASGAWLYIVLSAALQVGYSIFLVAAYRYGELGQVYPIVRGTIPLLVTVGGFIITGDEINSYQIAGVVLVALGIMSLALGKGRASTSSILFALVTGAIIAAYATVDSIGVRQTGQSGAYTAWVLVLYGAFLLVAFLVLRRRLVVDFRAPDTWKALGGGLVAMVAYGVIVAAFALGPAGPITALRETSVVFAVLIGWLFLGEALAVRRIIACVIVASGAILLGH
ncbi:DMT family transporter [Agrobacterium sp. SHOUNA12C]|jgi:drug/metabolite transporter (DMT)-like permease|uniref:EamA domain-containing protein n=1 Tax=Rhizobium rhizogenes NBRC 13257 TaxID=1220581 RepID=A0AA87Q4I3_RHIRH|nr:DMT family transporter [Rhizobium rhizogenes]KAA6485615.1 EamA family transporter [Agrobacterium sp. ICMP 7243]MCJ9723326.1 DMT family transporter [Agrobacterium sp. BETTINA12B]MCJ9759685.1 DMT family transporter [Agrobacterium sp. SHOUNA12C]NTF49853.1 EamA family transporter [Rhizobium rhizogenes]NTF56480.1 EamA family transporter [Rhizobium rhizogenes]